MTSIVEEPDPVETPKSASTFRWNPLGSLSTSKPIPIAATMAPPSSDSEEETSVAEQPRQNRSPALPPSQGPEPGSVAAMLGLHNAVYPDHNALTIDMDLVRQDAHETSLDASEHAAQPVQDQNMQNQHSKRVAKSEGQRQGRVEPSILRCTKFQVSYYEEMTGSLKAGSLAVRFFCALLIFCFFIARALYVS